MQKLVEKALNAETVMDALIQHFTSKGDSKQAKTLSEAKNLLAAVSFPQSERCVSDAQLGAIATLVAVKCANRSKAVLVMVTDSPMVKRNTEALSKTVSAMRMLEYFPDDFVMAVKRPARDYLCVHRLNNAGTNGHDLPPKLWRTATTDGLDRKLADKVCANSCGKHCSYRDTCRYQRVKENMREGIIQVQVYGVTQYRDAQRKGLLPKSRMVVYTPETRSILLETLDYALYADDLIALASECEKHCTTVKARKKFVAKQAEDIRGSVSRLCGGAAEREANTLVNAIKQAIANIQRECARELREYKRRRMDALLHTTTLQINRILERGTHFMLCYGRETKRIRIGTPITEARWNETTTIQAGGQ